MSGHDDMTSPYAMRLTQAEADREVWEFLHRASRIANSDSFVWELQHAFLFGAYLTRCAAYRELGIAVQLRRKPKFSALRASPLLEAFRRRRVRRVLKGGRPCLTIVPAEEFDFGEVPVAVLYQAPGAGPIESPRIQHPPPESWLATPEGGPGSTGTRRG